MKLLDFHRSFFSFEQDFDVKPPATVSDFRQNRHNRARIRIDCRCRVTQPDGIGTDYYLGESCKAERVGCERAEGLFIQPNADFRLVYSSRDDVVIFKSWDRNNRRVMLIPRSLGPQPERQVLAVKGAFYRHGLQIASARARELKRKSEIFRASLDGRRIVARTAYGVAGYKVLLEYPVLTLNTSDRHGFFQVDTGPVIYPEITRRTRRVADSFRLAFVAFNSADWTEFIVQKPTPVGRGLSVNHYSETVQIDCTNSLYATE
jgi:hypothetical protein